jgi:nucleoside-specific outer membrane channel protein Tsx
MIQTNNSFKDSKQETLYLSEDSQISVPGDSNQINVFAIYDLLLVKIKAYSFIVDWQLQEIELPEVNKSLD